MNDWLGCIIHLDQCLGTLAQAYPTWVLGILFAVIFAETGLVVCPFLPGDSLLFIAGALAAAHISVFSIHTLAITLIIAATLGNMTNYMIGKKLGQRVTAPGSQWQKWIKPEYLKQTEAYFERYGILAIIIGRFAPIIRTFIPFLAGIGHMSPGVFLRYNFIGALFWVVSFVYAGYYFGSLPIIQNNLKWIMLAIIIISFIPIFIQLYKSIKAARRTDSK